MPKLIVKSKSWCFNGLYFRQTLPNSIEWTSFEMAAAVFESPDEAKLKMDLSGIKYWELGEQLEPYCKKIFTPSDKTGFKP